MSDMLFEDLLVIDCASFVAGPAAATILGDFGARVIKVEPLEGDGYRLLRYLPGLPRGDTNYPWSLTNRNKESLALDLKNEQGRAFLDTLLANADVFITNYPLPVRERLRLNYDNICAINPNIIYASLTPYGEDGPEAGNTGYDATAWWARSGLMDTVRASADTPPAMSVPAMGDHMAANTLYGAIVTALYQRELTGKGSKVGTSLMANGLWSNGLYVQAALDGADMAVRLDQDSLSAFTNIYRCKDDRWFIMAVLLQAQDKAFPSLALCVGREEWVTDPRFADIESRQKNNAELKALLAEAFLQEEWSVWDKRFAEHHVTCGKIARAADHIDCEQAQAADMFSEFDDGSGERTLSSPLYVAGATKRAPSPAPELGEHSLAILEEFAIDSQTASTLKDAGIVGGGYG